MFPRILIGDCRVTYQVEKERVKGFLLNGFIPGAALFIAKATGGNPSWSRRDTRE